MTILPRDSAEFQALTGQNTTSEASGTLVQLTPADLAAHWEETLSDSVGFSIDSLLDVKLIDVEQRIDLALSPEGFKLEVVPLGTNYLRYEIMDNRAGEPVSFADNYNGGFETAGQVQDFAYLDLFGDTDIGTRDFFIRYEGLIEVAPGQPLHSQSLFQFETVGGFTLMIDGQVVKVATPGEEGSVLTDLAPGWHKIELLVAHDPLVAESPTARTDDDLKLSFGTGRPDNAGGVREAVTGDLFDHVRTTPDQLIAVTADVIISVGDYRGVFPHSFYVTSLDQIKTYVDAATAKLNPAADTTVSYEVTWTTEVTVEEADNYAITGSFAPDTATITLNGDEQVLTADGDTTTATLRLPDGTHELSVTQTFDSQAAWQDGSFNLTWSGADTGGREVVFPEDAPALTDGFFDTLAETINSVGDWIEESGAIPLDLGPIVATPTLTFNLGIDAELGWNIELPGVGRTVTSQPVSFALNSTDEVEAGGTLTAWASDLMFLAPTTRNFLLEMGSAEFTSEFALPETLLKDVGVFIGTSSVAEELVDEIFGEDSALARLNSSLNDLVTFKLVLDKAVSLDEITGAVSAAAEASGARDPDKAFDLDGFIEGLYSGKVNLGDTLSDLLRMVGEGDFEGAFSLFYQVAGLAPDAEEPTPGEEPTPEAEALTVKTAEGEDVTLTPTQVLELAKAAALYAGAIGTGEDTAAGDAGNDTVASDAGNDVVAGDTGNDTVAGDTGNDTVAGDAGNDTVTGDAGNDTIAGDDTENTATPSAIVSITHATLGAINVSVDAVEGLLKDSGLADVFGALSTLFNEGYEILPGLTVSGNLPIGEAFQHYGWDGLLDDDVAASDDTRDAPAPIVTETTIELLKVSADVRQMYFGAALEAIDKQLEREDLTAGERKALMNAKIAAAIQPLMLEILEEGASAELTLNQGPVLHALTDLFLGLIDDITSGLNSMVDFFVPGDFNGIATDLVNNELINMAFENPDQFEVLAREALQPVADFMKTIPDFINDFIKGIGSAFVDVSPDTTQPPTLTDAYIAYIEQAVPLMYHSIYGTPADAIRVEITGTGWEAIDTRIEDIHFKRLVKVEDGSSVRAPLEQGTGMIWDGVQDYGDWLAEVVPVWWELNRGVPRESVMVHQFEGGSFGYAAYDTRTTLPEFKEVISIEYATDYSVQAELVAGTGEEFFNPNVETYGEWLARVVPKWWEMNGNLPAEHSQVVITSDGFNTSYKVYDTREAGPNPGSIDARSRAWENLSDLETYSGLDFDGTTHTYPDKAVLVGWLQTLIDVAAGVVDAALSDDVVNAIADTIDGILYGVDVAVPDSIAEPETYVAGALELMGFEFSRDGDDYLVVNRDSGLFGLMKDARTFPDEIRGFAQTLTDFFVNGIEMNFDDAIEDLMDSIAGFIPAMVKSITARADLDLNLFEMVAEATLELTQRTTFDPSAVKIEYTWGDQTIVAEYGDAVQFDVPVDYTGEAPDVQARLIFDGAYTYEYLLKPNFDLDFEMFGFSILGELEHGGELLFSDTIEYALIKTTDDIDPDDILSQFDDAVIEIDVREIEAAMIALFDGLVGAPIRAVLGDDSETTDGTISLGTITDVDLEEDLDGNTFTSVTATNGVTVLTPTTPRLRDGTSENDSLTGADGADTLNGNDGDDVLTGGAGADSLDGGAGNDRVSYATSAAAVIVALDSGTATGGDAEGDVLAGIEHLTGSRFADQLTGSDDANRLVGGGQADTLSGGAGDDLLIGGVGNDSVLGGDGDDTLFGDTGADYLAGGDGLDHVTYANSTAGVNVSLLAETGLGGFAEDDILVSIERLTGSAHNDTLTGSNGDDALRGGAGADRLDGGAGIDRASYATAETGVTVNLALGTGLGGEAEGDILLSIERLIGSAHADALTGNADANLLQGGAGSDTLDGLGGNDALVGGEGADAFVFSTGFGRDRITDFTGDDMIVLSSDLLSLNGIADVADLLQDNARQIGTNVDIRFSSTDVLRLEQITLAEVIDLQDRFSFV